MTRSPIPTAIGLNGVLQAGVLLQLRRFYHNMWTAANVKYATETRHGLEEDGKAFTADDTTSSLSEDPVELDIGETDDLSALEDVLQGLDPLGGFGD